MKTPLREPDRLDRQADQRDDATVWEHDEVVVADQVRDRAGLSQAARAVALVAGAVVTVIGLIAALRIDWGTAEFDAPLVSAADMAFSPTTAVFTAVLGFFLIGAAASHDSPARITLGAIPAALGAAILLLEDVGTSWNVSDRHGWLALLVGGVFVVAGLLSERRDLVERRRAVRRTVG
ncbi:MAG TPA: hypothetical protein PKE56_05255 [Acidimicrobiales bacterium]|nr:hypothetical protein [Acidimicrobiales bacterium]